jgi:phospholipid/cholesterol/gamma-HCH transport system substrate-binding protein
VNRATIVKLVAFAVVAMLGAAMEWGTLTGPHVGSTHTYHAMFASSDGVSGLRSGNVVKSAGVPVGKVSSVVLKDATHAEVTFNANNDQVLDTNTWAVVRYANLLGQRYLALTESGTGAATPLRPGGTIPAERTAPALSLTTLFNGFRPLFAALTPAQVNDLSGDILAVLQGQTGMIDDLVAKTAQLTSNLADRDQTFSTVVDNLSALLTTVSQHDDQLAGAVTALSGLTQQLHTEGPAIMSSLSSVDHLIGSVGGLFDTLENHNLPTDIADVASITHVLGANTATLQQLIAGFVTAFTDFSRVSQNGGWVNAYLCNASVITYGAVSVSAADIVNSLGSAVGLGGILSGLGLGSTTLAALALPTPLKLPNGQIGSGGHTKVCS